MKSNFIKIAFFSICCSLLFTGCNKDDDSGPTNHLNYSGIKHELTKGYLENYGRDFYGNVYNFDLILCSSGINVTEDSHSGVGNFFRFIMDDHLFRTLQGLNPGQHRRFLPRTRSSGTCYS